MNPIYLSARIDYDKVWGIAGFLCPVATVQHIRECVSRILANLNAVPQPNTLIGRVRPATAWQHLARAVVLAVPLFGSLFFLIYDYRADLDRHGRLFAEGSNLETLETNLNNWVQQGQPTEDRRRAAEEILYAYHHERTSLTLETPLTSFPAEIALLPHLTSLFFSNNQITSFPAGINLLTRLTRLLIRGEQLSSVPPEIGELTNLTDLAIIYTQCSSLPTEIEKLTRLTQLDLRGNRLNSLPPQIGHLIHVTYLDLDDNPLNSLPDEMGHMRSLKELRIENGELLHLPSSLGQIASLERIKAGIKNEQLEPQIEEILGESRFYRSPAQINYIPSIEKPLLNASSLNHEGYDQFIEGLQRWVAKGKTWLRGERGEQDRLKGAERMLQAYIEGSTQLDLRGLGLYSLPPQIGELKALQSLDLSYTQLTSLPVEITQLKMLTHLDLASNHFAEIPEEILQLTTLQILNMYHNRLATLPEGLGDLTELTELYLTRNCLSLLPDSITNLTKLIQLSFSENNLTELPHQIGCLIHLTHLYSSQNRLTTLPPSIIGLSELKTLDLAANQLQKLPKDINQLISLETLDLSENPHLTELPLSLAEIPSLFILRPPSRDPFCSMRETLTAIKEARERHSRYKYVSMF